jgi:ElaB/YqjD/DUF883 family membrane-anchored ribosome-binding protein
MTMDEQDYTEYSNGNSYASETASNIKGGLTAVKEKVNTQTAELKGKLRDQANSLGSQIGQKIDNARGKTSEQLRTTSRKFENMASYVENNDAKDMSNALLHSSQDLVRKHPGKSILAGLIVGVVLGRLFSFGGTRYVSR